MSYTFCNLIQLGPTFYITSDGTSGGTEYIATVKGTDAFENINGQDIRALSGTVYQQITDDAGDIIDAPIDITFPLLKVSDRDAILAVINAYAGTPFTLVITGDPGTYTGTAKPAFSPKPVEYSGEFRNGKITNVTVHLLMTLS
jgi:hypothetical protein